VRYSPVARVFANSTRRDYAMIPDPTGVGTLAGAGRHARLWCEGAHQGRGARSGV